MTIDRQTQSRLLKEQIDCQLIQVLTEQLGNNQIDVHRLKKAHEDYERIEKLFYNMVNGDHQESIGHSSNTIGNFLDDINDWLDEQQEVSNEKNSTSEILPSSISNELFHFNSIPAPISLIKPFR